METEKKTPPKPRKPRAPKAELSLPTTISFTQPDTESSVKGIAIKVAVAAGVGVGVWQLVKFVKNKKANSEQKED